MFGMMIDAGPKFYLVPSPPPYLDLKVKVTDLELLCECFTLKFLGSIISKLFDGFGSFLV